MADLSSILTDPNYVNANAATKQAIFDKFSANDTNFTGANPATQDAIRVKFGVAAMPAPAPMGVDAIPGQRSISKAEAPLSTSEKIRGVIETPFAVGANLISGPITYLAGALGPEAQQAVAKEIQYQPRTRLAQNVLEGIGRTAEGLPPFMPTMGVTNALRTATRPSVNVLAEEGQMIKSAVGLPFEQRANALQQERVAQSVRNAPQIEAAQKAAELGIVLNPAASNPTKMNKIKGVVIGNKAVDTKAAALNDSRWGELAKEEMGLSADTVLDKKAFETARDNVSAPYRVIEKMPALMPTQEIGSALNKLRQSEELIGGAKTKAAIDSLVDDAMTKIGGGMSGNQVIKNIRQMRNEAQDIYKAKKAGAALSPEEIATAETKLGIANSLEALIESNIQDPKALDDFKKARVAMAKTYAYEAATDMNTGKLDPMAIAKITAGDNNLTGVIADIGKIAGNFPEIAKAGTVADRYLPTLSRSGIGGSAGYAIGSLFGAPLTGSIAGAALGGLTSAAGAKGITNTAYQLAHAVPTDYRPPANMLRPANINYGPNQLTPYDYGQTAETPYRPNWTPGQPEVNFPASAQYAGPAPTPPQLGAPSAEGTMGALRAEQARKLQIDRALAQQAETAAQAQAAATRAPTRGAVELQINPLTGVPEIAKGLKGATPETFQNFGQSLQAASEKVSAGKLFDLTAAEKVAWNKTKADLAVAGPEFSKLTDKAISAKMMDRAWVDDAIVKARQQANAFDTIASRAADERVRQLALVKREQMMDLLDTLEAQFSKERPTAKGSQGPKTRAAQRNVLATEKPQDVINKLNDTTPGRP